MPWKRSFTPTSREKVTVVLRQRTSPSPAFSLVKRVFPVEVTALIAFGSPSTAAAVARQKSMSKPCHSPASSG